MKNSGVRRPKQRPPRLRTMIPDRGLLFVTSMALTVYYAKIQRLRHVTSITCTSVKPHEREEFSRRNNVTVDNGQTGKVPQVAVPPSRLSCSHCLCENLANGTKARLDAAQTCERQCGHLALDSTEQALTLLAMRAVFVT